MTTTQFKKRKAERAERTVRRPPTSPGRGTRFPGKVEKLTVSITSEAARRIREIASALGCTVSDAVEESIRAYRLP